MDFHIKVKLIIWNSRKKKPWQWSEFTLFDCSRIGVPGLICVRGAILRHSDFQLMVSHPQFQYLGNGYDLSLVVFQSELKFYSYFGKPSFGSFVPLHFVIFGETFVIRISKHFILKSYSKHLEVLHILISEFLELI